MPRGLALQQHGHEEAQICLLLEGEYLERTRGRAWHLRPGSTWFRPPRELHANIVAPEEDALTLLVSIGRDRFASLERCASDPRLLRSELLGELRSEMRRELQSGDAGAVLALEGWALLLLSRTGRLLGGGDLQTPEWLDDALHLIRQTYCQPISLSTVAARVAVHPATLAAACRRFHHISVGELIRELRLRHAWKALVGSRAPIKQIAVEAGFYDQAHLGRLCRRRLGLSPAEIRVRQSPFSPPL